MVKNFIHYLKLLLLLLADYLLRSQKFVKFVYSGKHEVQRICENQSDIYEKTMKIDCWLARTSCRPICDFFTKHFATQSTPKTSIPRKAINRILINYRQNNIKSYSLDHFAHLEDGDILISSAVRELTGELLKVIKKTKNLKNISKSFELCLADACYRILSYKLTILLAEQLASTKYDADLEVHTEKLMNLWNNLVQSDHRQAPATTTPKQKLFPSEYSDQIYDKRDIVSGRWSHIGFQGEDPGTDFRGMGMLGLTQLEYLSRRPKTLARDLLKRSLTAECHYPFAIVGINITYNLLNLFRDGSMKHLYYDTSELLFRSKEQALNPLTTLNMLYVELFLRFDCFWHESKPKTIFEFKTLMEEFVNIIRMDLEDRNFSLKFIY